MFLLIQLIPLLDLSKCLSFLVTLKDPPVDYLFFIELSFDELFDKDFLNKESTKYKNKATALTNQVCTIPLF